jgi:hypothetical protein
MSSGPDKPSIQILPIFLLIGHNRMAAAADKRADLDLQIRPLAEQEATRLVTLPPRQQSGCTDPLAGGARPQQLPGDER